MRQADRPTAPAKYEIALYWQDREPEFVYDIAAPGCFACGWLSDRWPEAADHSVAALRRLWGATRGLEICHIIPHSLGGPTEAPNLVLLCNDCHKAAPDFIVPEYMLKWMRSRAPFIDTAVARMMAAIEEAAETFGLTWPPTAQDADDLRATIRDPGFWEFYKDAVAIVPNKPWPHKAGTFMAAYCEYREIRLEPGELFGVSEGGAFRYVAA